MRSARIVAAALAVLLVIPIAGARAGEVSGDLMTGVYPQNAHQAATALNAIGSAAGQKVTFGGTFIDVYDDSGSPQEWSNTRAIFGSIWSAQATPFVNVGVGSASAASIASGKYDGVIANWVQHVKTFLDLGGLRSVIVAPLQEQNGDWTPYGCDPTNFKAAYRTFVDAFRQAGIDETQVRFAWAPNGWTSPNCGSLADYYPGNDIVDIVSISAYNFGTCVAAGKYETPAQAFDPYLNEIRTTIPGAANKPFMIAQTASPRAPCGGDQSSWVQTMMDHLANDPNVVGFAWFNYLKETDWRVWTGTDSSLPAGWKQGINTANTAYRWPLTAWFSKGELTIGPPAPEVVPCPNGGCDVIASVDVGSRWGRWSELSRQATVSSFYFGNPGDMPFMGDWDGDGVATPGLYRQSDGFVYVKDANTQGVADREFFFGNPGDVPLVGDFDGDGRDSVSIWRPAEARVFVINELGADGGGLGAAEFSFSFGNPGDTPFVGDFDGDGIDTVGLYRQSTGFVYFRNSNTTGIADLSFFYGNPGDQILAGDWDGDGDDTVAVYRPSTGRVYMNLENTNGAADWDGYVGTYPYVLTAGNRK
jgi:hypothetical protein